MGSMLISQCKCGFESDCLSVGGGMMDFNEKCWTPCYCDECELVMTINILTKEGKKGYYRCTKCKKRVNYYGELGEETLFSGRVAPAVYGLGLLEAIPEAKILEMADRYDSDRDGISGRVNWVKEKPSGQKAIGRFGWKGGQPSLKQQAAVAFLSDIGITNSLMPEENWNFKDDQKGALISGGQPELSDDFLDKITFYLQTLAVPAQRNWDQSEVLKGKALFLKVGCGKCHHPEFKTGSHPVTELSDQQIFPYTYLHYQMQH